jgi:hypothetical protein
MNKILLGPRPSVRGLVLLRPSSFSLSPGCSPAVSSVGFLSPSGGGPVRRTEGWTGSKKRLGCARPRRRASVYGSSQRTISGTRPVHTTHLPDQAAKSIRLDIKSQKKRRWNLPFTTRGQYLRESSAATVYPWLHQTLATYAARQAPRPARERSRTIPSPRDQRLEFKRKRQSPFSLLRATIRTGSRLPTTA